MKTLSALTFTTSPICKLQMCSGLQEVGLIVWNFTRNMLQHILQTLDSDYHFLLLKYKELYVFCDINLDFMLLWVCWVKVSKLVCPRWRVHIRHTRRYISAGTCSHRQPLISWLKWPNRITSAVCVCVHIWYEVVGVWVEPAGESRAWIPAAFQRKQKGSEGSVSIPPPPVFFPLLHYSSLSTKTHGNTESNHTNVEPRGNISL